MHQGRTRWRTISDWLRGALRVLVTAVLATCPTAEALGQVEAKGETEHVPEAADPGSGAHWAVLPIAYYTPETSLALGGMVVVVSTPGAADTKASTGAFNGTYTLKHQVILGAIGAYYPDPRWMVLFDASAKLSWPDRFYAAGNAAGAEDYEDWTGRSIEVQARVLRRIGVSHLFAGPVVAFGHFDVLEQEAGGRLAAGAVPGTEAHTLLAGGLVASWDSRDASVQPRSGAFHTISLINYERIWGADVGFRRLETDLRYYVPIRADHVFALRGRLTAAWGTVPFTMHALVGGMGGGLRGIYETRYADHAAAVVVAEYRLPLVWRLGAVVFAGAGRVAPSLSDLRFEGLHAAGGAGLRFALLRASRLNVGLDVAIGGAALNVYTTLGEVF